MNNSAKFQLHHLIASEEIIFDYVFANLALWLPWQPIKFIGLDKTHIHGFRGDVV